MNDAPSQPRRRGRPAQGRAAQRKLLAQKLGISERTVRRAEANGEQAVALTTEIDTIGMTVQEEFLVQVNEVAIYLRKAASHLRAAQQQLTYLANSTLGYPESRVQRLHELAQHATAAVLDAIPTSLCPYCKGLPGVIEQCATCLTLGYVGDGIRLHVDRELLDADNPMVMVSGRRVLVETYLEEQDMLV